MYSLTNIPCKFGNNCRSFKGEKCRFGHQKQSEIAEMTKFMKEQSIIHKHITHKVCAIQYIYSDYESGCKSVVYTTIDGTQIFRDGYPVSNILFRDESNKMLNNRLISDEVYKMYYQWYKNHAIPDEMLKSGLYIPFDGCWERPFPLKAHASFCT